MGARGDLVLATPVVTPISQRRTQPRGVRRGPGLLGRRVPVCAVGTAGRMAGPSRCPVTDAVPWRVGPVSGEHAEGLWGVGRAETGKGGARGCMEAPAPCQDLPPGLADGWSVPWGLGQTSFLSLTPTINCFWGSMAPQRPCSPEWRRPASLRPLMAQTPCPCDLRSRPRQPLPGTQQLTLGGARPVLLPAGPELFRSLGWGR